VDSKLFAQILLATGLGFTTYQKPWGSLQNILLSADVEP
jgi:hypothetical protein